MTVDNQQEQQEQEDIDLGIETPEEEEIVLDHATAIAKLKPTVKRVFELLNVKGEGNTQEEYEQSLLDKQSVYEKDTRDNLVPMIVAKMQQGNSNKPANQQTRKVGVTTTSTSTKPRVTKQFTGY